MKVNTNRAARRAQERKELKALRTNSRSMAQDIFGSMVNANLETESVVLAAVKRHFRLGEKRMKEFMAFLKVVKAEYEEYSIDDIFREKIDEEFRPINIDLYKEMTSDETLEHAIKMYVQQIEPNITPAEAEHMQGMLNGFKRVLEGE